MLTRLLCALLCAFFPLTILAEDFESAASLRDREKDLQLAYDSHRLDSGDVLKHPM